MRVKSAVAHGGKAGSAQMHRPAAATSTSIQPYCRCAASRNSGRWEGVQHHAATVYARGGVCAILPLTPPTRFQQ